MISGCPWGDAKKFFWDGVLTSCEESLQKYGVAGVCGNPEAYPFCCDSCDKLAGDYEPGMIDA